MPRLGLLHLAPALGDVDRNRALIESATTRAAELGADWVISGELVVSGYGFVPVIGTDWIAPQPDPWMSSYAALIASLGVVCFVSHPERDCVTDRLFNSLFVFGRDGEMLGRQTKLDPIPVSEDWATRGSAGVPISIDDVSVGLLICADVYRAEPAMRLREHGAELLMSCAAWWPGEWGPKGEWEARTAETRLPMIVCNRTGTDGARRLVDSESVIVDRGERLLTLRAPTSTVFIVDCELGGGRIASCDLISSDPISG